MSRFLVLNQPDFDGHPGMPGSPMHKVYTPEQGKWVGDIDPNMSWSVIIEADHCKDAFVKAMGMEPYSYTATSKDGVTSFSIKVGDWQWRHVWVIQLGL